jgi:hypothetical protein
MHAVWTCVTQLYMPAAIETAWWINVIVHMNTGELNKKQSYSCIVVQTTVFGNKSLCFVRL